MSVIDGLSNTGWFHTLKKSAENFRDRASVTVHCFARDISQFCSNGPRKTLRPSVPKPVEPSIPIAGAGTKAAGFTYEVNRCSMLPVVSALDNVYPEARLGEAVSGIAVP